MSHLNPSPAKSKPISAPSPTPSNASNNSNMAPSKRRPQPTVPYSQPTDTGSGTMIITQVFYVQSYLKDKDRPLTFDEIWDYLSIPDASDYVRTSLRQTLQSGRVQSVEYDKNSKTYRYKSQHGVRNQEQLRAYLQKQSTMKGIQVKELRDGWKDANTAIERLAADNQLLVLRERKEPHLPRVVFADDPSLYGEMRQDFKAMWLKTPLPASAEELRNKLLAAGQKPATEKKIVAATGVKKEKKKKGPRKGGKVTNKHVMHMLKDYSWARQ